MRWGQKRVSVFPQVTDLFPGTTRQSRGRTDTLDSDTGGACLVTSEGLIFILRTAFGLKLKTGDVVHATSCLPIASLSLASQEAALVSQRHLLALPVHCSVTSQYWLQAAVSPCPTCLTAGPGFRLSALMRHLGLLCSILGGQSESARPQPGPLCCCGFPRRLLTSWGT